MLRNKPAKCSIGLFLLFCILFFAACTSVSELPPVIDHSKSGIKAGKTYRIVRPGDTLYSIAWQNGVDYRVLAKRNGIGPPYLIKPGQKVVLLPTTRGRHSQRTDKVRVYKVRRGDTLYSIGRRFSIKPDRLARMNRLHVPYTIRPGQKLRLNVGHTTHATVTDSGKSGAATANIKNRIALSRKTRIRGWIWPTTGPVIANYAVNHNKGIDIAGKRGQTIKAVASGQVVYIGSRLPGYGLLIIIKHNTDYFSAYAHNHKTYVKEKDVIKKGTKIATMGSSGTDRVKLHFEIRYRGTPVNPLRLLPKR